MEAKTQYQLHKIGTEAYHTFNHTNIRDMDNLNSIKDEQGMATIISRAAWMLRSLEPVGYCTNIPNSGKCSYIGFQLMRL